MTGIDLLDRLLSIANQAWPFIVVLGILIFVHELGHYLAARWRRVHVEAFSIGFGRALVGWTDRQGTYWKVGWLPLGGYVRLHGQDPSAEPGAEAAPVRAGWTFHDKPVRDRALIVAAGPAANYLLAAILFAALFATMGRPLTAPVVIEPVPGGGAAIAGLQANDRITALDDQPVARFEDIARFVAARPGQTIVVSFTRGGQPQTATLTVGARANADGSSTGVAGIRGGLREFVPVNPLSAVWQGAAYTIELSQMMLTSVWEIITGRRGTEELGGPIRIAQMSAEVAEGGIVPLITFIAILSVNLGLLNLFPVPVLDGGHLVFYAIEWLRGRPLSLRAQEIGLRAGFAVLITLMVVFTYQDLLRTSLGRWVQGLLG